MTCRHINSKNEALLHYLNLIFRSISLNLPHINPAHGDFLHSHPSTSKPRQPRLHAQFDCRAAIRLTITISSLYQKITAVRKLEKCLSAVWFCVREKKKKKKRKKKKKDRQNNKQRSVQPSCCCIHQCQRSVKGGVTRRGKLTMKRAHTNTHAYAHARLEADAVLISVTAAEPLAAQIAAGAQTMEGRACLHKGEHRNKRICGMQTPPRREHRQHIQRDGEKNTSQITVDKYTKSA